MPRLVRLAFLLVPGLSVGSASAGAAGAVPFADSAVPAVAPVPSATSATADSAGTPNASGQGLLGSGSSGALSPSGGSANGGACLSVLSDIPVPNLSGSGFSCDSTAPPGGQSASPGSASSSRGSSTPAQGAVARAGSADPSASGSQSAACQSSQPVANHRPPGAASSSNSQLPLLAIALLSLAAGYGLAVARRGRSAPEPLV
jgi:hypothetical protein